MPIFDCSRPLDPDTPVYPGDPPVERAEWATHEEDGYRVARLSLGTHAGTHVDAPAHTEPGPPVADSHTIDEFDPGRFRFRAALADLTHLDARDPIEPADLPALDALPADCDLLVCHTGWGRSWGTDRYRDHPYLARETAAELAGRGLALGLDTFGPDPTPSPNAGGDEPDGVPAHRALLGAGLPIVENLRLDGLAAALEPGEGFVLCAYPLLVVDGDAAPCRAVARVE